MPSGFRTATDTASPGSGKHPIPLPPCPRIKRNPLTCWRSTGKTFPEGSRPGRIIDTISRLIKVNRLKEILVFEGFSRIEPTNLVPPDIVGRHNWIPAMELYGEGIFFTVDEDRLGKWEKDHRVMNLSKEQEDARALPKRGQHLVIGGPGTGKSVLALLRARKYTDDKEEYAFLVYNKLLHEASCHLAGNSISVYTWKSWFFKKFFEFTGLRVPLLKPSKGSTWQEIDWGNILDIAKKHSRQKPPAPEFLIIDEGQDMPPEFYRSLFNLGFENLFVVADQNQQIVSGKNSSRMDLEIELGLDSETVIELKENFRNFPGQGSHGSHRSIHGGKIPPDCLYRIRGSFLHAGTGPGDWKGRGGTCRSFPG